MIQDIKTKNIKSRIRERIKDFTSKLMEHPEEDWQILIIKIL